MAPEDTEDREPALAEERSGSGDVVEIGDRIERGRQSYARRAWRDAYESLSLADEAAPLGAGDLELLATSAGMLGREGDYLAVLERAHHAHLAAGETLRAVRCAFWVGTFSAIRGETARASGWFGRAHRLLEREERPSAEQGYLLVTAIMDLEEARDYEAAFATAVEGAAVGERCGDADLIALAVHEQGLIRVKQGRIEAGLALLDEVMVAVSTGELSPIVTGLLYCSVIDVCRQVYELRRAREWTAAMTRWCEEQPQMVSFTGSCRVHRAEIMQVDGAWTEALEEARRARGLFAQGLNPVATGEACYRQGEIHRLRGERAAAEESYREASRYGREPQPGLALLRLAQGDNEAAAAAIRRVAAETTEPMQLSGLLPAYVEIMLAVGDREEARSACRELEELTQGYRTGILDAMVAQAQGAVSLAEGDAGAALTASRHAGQVWQELGAPYESARARVQVALACRELGDEDAAEMELDAARSVFRDLRAAPDLAAVERLSRAAALESAGGLTGRELEVLRLVATGRTNRAIADDLVISEKTVARHVSNIFTKLGLSSRSAVTAYAYEHELV